MTARLAVTTGDSDGVGLEVAIKSLQRLPLNKNYQMVFFCAESPDLKNQFRKLKKKYRLNFCKLSELDEKPLSPKDLIVIKSDESPAAWVEFSARQCLAGKFAGLVTGPLSKAIVQKHNSADLGHNEILSRVTGSRSQMAFVGKKFNLLLVSGHEPLRKAGESVTLESLRLSIERAMELRKLLPQSLNKKPVGVLGLNPHSGEDGLIGQEELRVHRPAIKEFPDAEGPLVPDIAFFKKNWSRYSVFVANYHDQGLIPFKMVHEQGDAAQISLGIPIVRTSVDHGTAKEIFGRNKARPDSMICAIKWALRLIENKRGVQ